MKATLVILLAACVTCDAVVGAPCRYVNRTTNRRATGLTPRPHAARCTLARRLLPLPSFKVLTSIGDTDMQPNDKAPPAAQESQPATDKKPRAAPVKVSLGDANEALLARMKAEVKVPGTDIGLLTRGVETVLRDLQERLDAKGKHQTIEGVLGRQVSVPITASAVVVFNVQVADDEPVSYAFGLVPGREGVLPFNVEVGAVRRAPLEPEGRKVVDMGPEVDPTATPSPVGLTESGKTGAGPSIDPDRDPTVLAAESEPEVDLEARAR
ncbi:MAG: hypothetical protein ABR586_09585 [Thermoplasmatota archaeon]